jgi:hypothetical protein
MEKGDKMKLDYQLVEYMRREELPIYEEPLIRDKVKYEIKQEGKLFSIFTSGDAYKLIEKNIFQIVKRKPKK